MCIPENILSSLLALKKKKKKKGKFKETMALKTVIGYLFHLALSSGIL